MIRIDHQFVSILRFKKILRVGVSEIHIAMKTNNIIISGEDLYIYSFNKDEVIIQGHIKKVEFDERL